MEPGATRSVETDIGFCFSDKYLAKIYPCPSVSLKSVFLGGGIVDSNYRRNVRVILHNLSKKRKNRVEFNTGDCNAQAPFQKKILKNLLKLQILTITLQRETLKDLVQLAFKNGDK